MNNLRFLSEKQYREIINLFHLAETALAGTNPSRYERMVWASSEFNKIYPSISQSAAYKDLSTNMVY